MTVTDSLKAVIEETFKIIVSKEERFKINKTEIVLTNVENKIDESGPSNVTMCMKTRASCYHIIIALSVNTQLSAKKLKNIECMIYLNRYQSFNCI